MGVQMNIKNAEATALAGELASLTGMSVTQVVLEALRARKWELSKRDVVEEVMALARDTRARLSPEALALDHGEYLYDELGLPK
jgi:antitoxin VapB